MKKGKRGVINFVCVCAEGTHKVLYPYECVYVQIVWIFAECTLSLAWTQANLGENKLPLLRRYMNSAGKRRVVSFIIAATRSLAISPLLAAWPSLSRSLTYSFPLAGRPTVRPSSGHPPTYRSTPAAVPVLWSLTFGGTFESDKNVVPLLVFFTSNWYNTTVSVVMLPSSRDFQNHLFTSSIHSLSEWIKESLSKLVCTGDDMPNIAQYRSMHNFKANVF